MPALEQDRLVEKITELGDQAARGTDIEIVEVQLRGAGKARLLRIYIDKAPNTNTGSGLKQPHGVTHGDCSLISERIGALIDADESLLSEGYTLEVSSPGIDRKLTKPRDFQRVIGQKIRLAVREPIDGQTRFEGKLAGVAGQTIALEMQPGQVVEVPLDRVQKANLKFEW